eukprot:1602123-Lingulodinium_polyedra.AAC.1
MVCPSHGHAVAIAWPIYGHWLNKASTLSNMLPSNHSIKQPRTSPQQPINQSCNQAFKQPSNQAS